MIDVNAALTLESRLTYNGHSIVMSGFRRWLVMACLCLSGGIIFFSRSCGRSTTFRCRRPSA